MSVLGVIIAIIGLGFLILVHEFGHFIVAKATGMRVEEFSIGFGRYIISKRWGETVYGISWIPLGGYVRVTGMHREEFQARIEDAREKEAEARDRFETQELLAERDPGKKRRRAQDPEDRLAGPRALTADEIASTPLHRRYYAHPFWHKVLFIVAGVAMNMIIAFLLFLVIGLSQGQALPPSNVIEKVEPGTPAAAAGLQAGDKIVSIGGKEVSDWSELRTQIVMHAGDTVEVVYVRSGETGEVSVTLGDKEGAGYLGVQSAEGGRKDLGFAGSLDYAARTTGSTVKLIFVGIGMMFSGDAPVTGDQGLAGPVGIIQLSSQAVQGGYYLALLALISVNLAILNMLPVLPLDGGHVLFSIIEKIRGKPVSLKVFEQVSMVGLVLFAALFVLAMTNDIGRIF